LLLIALLSLKLLTEQSPDITDNGSKENKLLPTPLPVFLPGLVVFFTEQKSITMNS